MDFENGKIGGIVVVPAKEEDWEPAMDLCWKTFLRFEASVYTREGVMNFLKFISGEQLHDMFANGDYKVFVAKEEDRIVGVGSLRAGTHISLLFVDASYQMRGIGRALVRAMQQEVPAGDGCKLTVNSSPYGEGFYHRLGFLDTDKQQKADGILYTPMTLLQKI